MSNLQESSHLLTNAPNGDSTTEFNLFRNKASETNLEQITTGEHKATHDQLNIPLCILIIIFGWSSWINIRGLWMELPLIINKLPEYWNLPSYLNIITQASFIVPLTLIGLFWIRGSRSSSRFEVPANIVILIIGSLSCVLIAFVWQRTVIISGQKRSVPLLFLSFLMSLLDCTSSISYPLYMSVFPTSYMVILFIGEGLGALIPSFVALGQGAGRFICVERPLNATIIYSNVTSGNQNESALIPKLLPEAFPVYTYILILFMILVLSLSAFLCIEYMPYFRQFRTTTNRCRKINDCLQHGNIPERTLSTAGSNNLSKRDAIIYLIVITTVQAMMYGILPTFQTYSLLPFGNQYYSVGIKAANMAGPCASGLSLWIRTKSTKWLLVQFCICTLLVVYILVCASYSPSPPLQKSVFGGTFMVLVWTGVNALLHYLNVNIGLIFKEKDRTHLLLYGAAGQLGSLIASVPTFVLISVFKILQPLSQC